MTIEFEYDHGIKSLNVAFKGKFHPGEVTREWSLFFEEEFLGTGYNIFVDLNQAQLSEIPMEEVDELTQIFSRVYPASERPSRKVAIFAPDLLPFGLARAYEGMAIGTIEQTKTFRDIGEAKAWMTDGDTQ